MAQKLTVLVPSFNEENTIRDCLESVRWADEIFVVDSFSTDGTLDIARAYTDRIVQHEYVNSATQKNWAIPQCTHDWVLVIDCDERLTPALQDEIKALLAGEPDRDGYRIGRDNYFFGHRIRYSGWQHDSVLRLFKKDKGRYRDREVHADIDMPPEKVGRLHNKLEHYTYTTFDQYLEKFGRYTTWAANDLYKQGRKPSFCNLVLRPPLRFFKMYILKRGFLDGAAGFVLCALATMSVFMKYAKLWARLHDERKRGGNA